MEYEEDDDISFARWMSSFWGHSLLDENEKEGRGHKKRQTRSLNKSVFQRKACPSSEP
uniref:Leukemia NUP98 fusion partner 1 n=1 Tax=Coturnix japonica TaxID=93934 RepID=A0A8C2U457_COTJA